MDKSQLFRSVTSKGDTALTLAIKLQQEKSAMIADILMNEVLCYFLFLDGRNHSLIHTMKFMD